MAKIDEINRTEDLAFLLFHYAEEVDGITRLQKLLFLIEEETEFGTEYDDISFDFEPYKYGPFSEQVYDSVRYLHSMGAIQVVESDSNTDSIRDQEDQGEYAGKKFVLTEMGKKIARDVNKILDESHQEEIQELVSSHGEVDLEDLLEYVYIQHEAYTEKSEIKDEILG